jgi:pimeloyl-ACP methyl ester carboxylesterase
MLLRAPPEGYAACAEAIGAADFTETSRSIRACTLVVVGAEDEATPPSSAEALRDAIPGAYLVVLPNAAHIPTVEQPVAVLAERASVDVSVIPHVEHTEGTGSRRPRTFAGVR